MLYVGEGPRGSNGARSTLHRISVFHSATHNQTGPLWCWFRSKWACACPMPLWVSPMTSPVRLGVSPAAAPTPTGIFNQRFEAVFPWAGALGCAVCFAPCRLSGLSVRECGATGCYPPLCLPRSPPLWVRPSWFICVNVGPQGLLVVRLPAPFIPHSASLGPATATQVLSAPAACLCPSYRSGWMFIFYFLGAGLPCCSIFCQFWLCEEVQCVYLRRHLGSPWIFNEITECTLSGLAFCVQHTVLKIHSCCMYQ